MKIGDEVFVHGYVDEIRGNTVIIRNEGGYFGTSKEEIRSEKEIYKYFNIVFSLDEYIVVVNGNEATVLRKDRSSVTVETDFSHPWTL